MKAPYWDLAAVKRLSSQRGHLFFPRARDVAKFSSREEALAAARSAIASLTVRDFAETSYEPASIADVYGVRLDGKGWYLKLTVESASCVVISFHRAEFPIRTNRGVVKP